MNITFFSHTRMQFLETSKKTKDKVRFSLICIPQALLLSTSVFFWSLPHSIRILQIMEQRSLHNNAVVVICIAEWRCLVIAHRNPRGSLGRMWHTNLCEVFFAQSKTYEHKANEIQVWRRTSRFAVWSLPGFSTVMLFVARLPGAFPHNK